MQGTCKASHPHPPRFLSPSTEMDPSLAADAGPLSLVSIAVDHSLRLR